MSLYPLKISETNQDSKIQNLKASVDKSLEALITENPEISLNLKDLKSLTCNLYSECLLSLEKQKQKNKTLVSQFDQIQQEAALEFNLRQSDFIKQIDLFEAELRRLRQENRSMYDQLDSSFHSFESLKKSSVFILNEILKKIKLNSSFFNPREVEENLCDLKDLLEKHSASWEKGLSHNSEPLVSTESRFLDPIQKLSVRSSREKSVGFQFSKKLEDLKFISDKPPGQMTAGLDSANSLSHFLEEIYPKSRTFEKVKENFDPVKFDGVKPMRDFNRDYIETFRTGSEVQVEANDSFMTLNDSPGRETVSTIFPELGDSAYYKFKFQLK